jgi:predicted nucleic acid-binding protein
MHAGDLKGTFFLDTNVLIYTFDAAAPKKQMTARSWVREALRTQRGIIGSQVVQEFMNVALSRFSHPLGVTEAREYLREVLQPLCQHYPRITTFDRALLLKEQSGYSWYDALIVAAAIESGCAWLITEDLEHGRKFGSLTLHNPFRI